MIRKTKYLTVNFILPISSSSSSSATAVETTLSRFPVLRDGESANLDENESRIPFNVIFFNMVTIAPFEEIWKGDQKFFLIVIRPLLKRVDRRCDEAQNLLIIKTPNVNQFDFYV